MQYFKQKLFDEASQNFDDQYFLKKKRLIWSNSNGTH